MSATLIMNPQDIRDLAAAIVPHTDKKATHRGLELVFIDPDQGRFAWATDRFTAARYALPDAIDMPDEVMFIPGNALSTIARVGAGSLPAELDRYGVRIHQGDDETLTADFLYALSGRYQDQSHWGRTWFPQVIGKSVPVHKVFNDFAPGTGERPLTLDEASLGKFTAYARRVKEPLRIRGNQASPYRALIEVGRLEAIVSETAWNAS